MSRFLFVLVVCFFQSCQLEKSNQYEEQVRHLFFDENVGQPSQDLIDRFKQNNILQNQEPPTGWTSYPPLSAGGDNIRDPILHVFKFKNHPSLDSNFRKGQLIILSSWATTQISFPVLKFTFKTLEQSQQAYNVLLGKFEKIATSKKEEKVDDFYFITECKNDQQSTFQNLIIKSIQVKNVNGMFELLIALKMADLEQVQFLTSEVPN
jgi:hypothetical protein